MAISPGDRARPYVLSSGLNGLCALEDSCSDSCRVKTLTCSAACLLCRHPSLRCFLFLVLDLCPFFPTCAVPSQVSSPPSLLRGPPYVPASPTGVAPSPAVLFQAAPRSCLHRLLPPRLDVAKARSLCKGYSCECSVARATDAFKAKKELTMLLPVHLPPSVSPS